VIHTVTTYHNDILGQATVVAWHGANTMSKCIISANGVPVYTNVPSFYATNDTKCGLRLFHHQQQLRWTALVLNFDPITACAGFRDAEVMSD